MKSRKYLLWKYAFKREKKYCMYNFTLAFCSDCDHVINLKRSGMSIIYDSVQWIEVKVTILHNTTHHENLIADFIIVQDEHRYLYFYDHNKTY